MSTTRLESPRAGHGAPDVTRRQGTARQRPRGWNGWAFHGVMIPFTLLWVSPMVFVLLIAVRSFDDLAQRGLSSLPNSFTLSNFGTAGTDGNLYRAMTNSALITVPAVVLSLALASMAAFALSRYALPGRNAVLLLMLAGNLLPPQILLIPISRFVELTGYYDTLYALIAVHVGFGLGFYTFVLHGFMRDLPKEIQEAATIDGAGPGKIYASVILPLTRPALAALGALSFTWIFNDLLWSITVIRSGEKMPVTPALLGLQGLFVSSWNVIAAGTVIAAIPTLAVFLRFQKHFVSGLAIGAVK
jgi:multiple sugar transport system permease protein